MIERIVSGTAAVGETWLYLDEPLFPEEEAAIAHSVGKRRAEFRSVRGCARMALAQLGLDRPALTPGRGGAPTWPPGVVGSMTHSATYCAAAVAWRSDMIGIGIDAESNAPLPPEVLPMVTRPDERDHLAWLAEDRHGVCWDRLLFSVKESVYKIWYPLVGEWLGFEEVRVQVNPRTQWWTADLMRKGLRVDGRPVDRLDGRWLTDKNLVVVSVVLAVG